MTVNFTPTGDWMGDRGIATADGWIVEAPDGRALAWRWFKRVADAPRGGHHASRHARAPAYRSRTGIVVSGQAAGSGIAAVGSFKYWLADD